MEFNFSLEEEEICGHLVTVQMKKVWAVQLEMLKKFAEVCELHNLKWFASGGTLIGAVRHKGYIPWDDDIDIHMLADDYEKFCEVAPAELAPYFWQECRTQPGYGPRHGKIRNSQTTGCTEWEKDFWPASMNKGIFIDIFPLYYIPADEKIHKWQQKQLRKLNYKIFICHYIRREIINKPIVKRNLLHTFLHFCLLNKRRLEYFFIHLRDDEASLCRKYQEMCALQKEPTEYIGATSFDCEEERFIWPARNYREMVDLPFMGGTIKGPIEWDACLKRQYGDYMVIRKGGEMHSTIIFDVDVPYTQKIRPLPEFKA